MAAHSFATSLQRTQSFLLEFCRCIYVVNSMVAIKCLIPGIDVPFGRTETGSKPIQTRPAKQILKIPRANGFILSWVIPTLRRLQHTGASPTTMIQGTTFVWTKASSLYQHHVFCYQLAKEFPMLQKVCPVFQNNFDSYS